MDDEGLCPVRGCERNLRVAISSGACKMLHMETTQNIPTKSADYLTGRLAALRTLIVRVESCIADDDADGALRFAGAAEKMARNIAREIGKHA